MLADMSRSATGRPRSIGLSCRASIVVAAFVGAAVANLAAAQPVVSPRFSPTGPEADFYGAAQGYPVSVLYRPRFFVGAFTHQDQIWETRTVRRATQPAPLARAAAETALRYDFDRAERTLDDFMARNPVTGLLIARGDTIHVERYQYARTDAHRFAGYSMSKTVTALLVGVALAEGRIRSLDDPAERYVSELAGSEYGRTRLRHLLQMSSGVRFEETYTRFDDFTRLWQATVAQEGPGGAAAVRSFNERARLPGAVFSYASAETQVLGLVVARATGRTLAEYLQEKIWQPIGAEADARWVIDTAGQEVAYCCLNAVLRDWARLALLLANDGRIGSGAGSRQLVPREFLIEATTVAPEHDHLQLVLAPPGFSYGFQTWIVDPQATPPRRQFALMGAHGQIIFVDPASRLVLVQTAVRRHASDPNLETLALWHALVRTLGADAR